MRKKEQKINRGVESKVADRPLVLAVKIFNANTQCHFQGNDSSKVFWEGLVKETFYRGMYRGPRF